MKIKELIKKLSAFDPELEVLLEDGGDDYKGFYNKLTKISKAPRCIDCKTPKIMSVLLTSD